MTKIAVFVGSLQKESLNKKLAKNLEALMPEGVEFSYVDIRMPLFDQDLEKDYPPEAQAAKDIVSSADGVLFVTPEYNRSIPGVLKNAIDWVSRPYGTSAFTGKPVGLLGASISPVGTAAAQSDLHHITAFLSMKLMSQPELYIVDNGSLFDAEGQLIDERWRKNIEAYGAQFVNWVNKEK